MFLQSNWSKLVAAQKVGPSHNPKKKSIENNKLIKKPIVNNTATNTATAKSTVNNNNNTLNLSNPISNNTNNVELTSAVALDAEMVGVGPDGIQSVLARCSIVNLNGQILYDKYVKPVERVTDYRTAHSGIKSHHLIGPNVVTFSECQRSVAELINNRLLVGHSISNDLSVLLLSHPRHLIRDTAFYKKLCPIKPRSLRTLCLEHLNLIIQSGTDTIGHNSVEDARAVMELYKKYRKEWEQTLILKQKRKLNQTSANKNGNNNNGTISIAAAEMAAKASVKSTAATSAAISSVTTDIDSNSIISKGNAKHQAYRAKRIKLLHSK